MASRRKILTFDKFGQDPLSSNVLDKLLAIRNTITFTVTKREEANPQLIAFELYGDVELHWLVLYFNGLGYSFDLVSGMEIQLPNASNVSQIIYAETKNKRNPTAAARTITI